MRTAKRVTILVVVALACTASAVLRAGQGNAPQAFKEPSNTREAECLVRITIDAGVIPLNVETFVVIMHSPAVLGRSVKEILGPDAPQDRPTLTIEWMPEAGPYTGAGALQSRLEYEARKQDEEMIRQMEDIYGMHYSEMMGTQKTPDNKEAPADDSQSDNRSASKPQSRQEGSGSTRYGTPAGGFAMGGGMMGGMGAGAGGMGGGMMGGYYGYGTRTDSETRQITEQRVTIRLSVGLPEGVKPVAREFLNALVDNLRRGLMAVHEQHVRNIDELRINAVSKREDAEKRLAQAAGTSSPDEARIREQLDQMINFSAVTAQTPLKEAIEILKNSVVPVLPIVVQWNALESVRILPNDPAGIDGLPVMRVGTALDLLVKGFDKLGYRIQGGVIFVAPGHSLQQSGASAAKPKDQADVRILAARKNELARTIQSLELDLAGMQARRQAIQKQMATAEAEANDRLANDAVTQELEKLMQLSTAQFERLKQLVDTGRLSQTELAQGQESVARARVELARRREELTKSVSGSRLEQFNTELSRMTIDEAEKQTQLGILSNQLDEVQRQLVQASTFDPEAVRTRIAEETLETINCRIGELETRLATLQPPTVVMLGAN